MNNMITVFVGCLTLVILMFLKGFIKQMTRKLAEILSDNEEEQYILYKRLNTIIIVAAFGVSLVCYYIVLKVLGEMHFKMCICMKAAALSVALYAVFEQWFGENIFSD